MFTIKSRLLLLLLPVTLLILAALAGVHYYTTTEILTRQAQESLQTTVKSREIALTEYFESARVLGSTIASTREVQAFANVASQNLGDANQNNLKRMRQQAEKVLRVFQENHWNRFHHIFLLDRSNRIVVSPAHGLANTGSPSALLNRDLSGNTWAMQALSKGKMTVSAYKSSKPGDESYPVLFFPVRDSGNRVQAVVGIEMNIAHQQKIMTRGFDQTKGARIFLGSAQGMPITQQLGAHTKRLASDVVVQVKNSGRWSGRRLTSEDEEVFSHYVKHDRYPWILGAEIETSEVFADLYVLHMILLGGLIGVLLAIAILSVIFAKQLIKPIEAIVAEVEKVSRGELDIEISGADRKDELGKLSAALQQVVFSMQQLARKLRQYRALKKAS